MEIVTYWLNTMTKSTNHQKVRDFLHYENNDCKHILGICPTLSRKLNKINDKMLIFHTKKTRNRTKTMRADWMSHCLVVNSKPPILVLFNNSLNELAWKKWLLCAVSLITQTKKCCRFSISNHLIQFHNNGSSIAFN